MAAGSSDHLLRSRSGGIENVLQESRLQLFPDAAKIPKFKILWDLRPRLNPDALTKLHGVAGWGAQLQLSA